MENSLSEMGKAQSKTPKKTCFILFNPAFSGFNSDHDSFILHVTHFGESCAKARTVSY